MRDVWGHMEQYLDIVRSFLESSMELGNELSAPRSRICSLGSSSYIIVIIISTAIGSTVAGTEIRSCDVSRTRCVVCFRINELHIISGPIIIGPKFLLFKFESTHMSITVRLLFQLGIYLSLSLSISLSPSHSSCNMRMYGLGFKGHGKKDSYQNSRLVRRPGRGDDGNIGGSGDLGC